MVLLAACAVPKKMSAQPWEGGATLQYVGCCARQPCAPLLVSDSNLNAICMYGNDLTTQAMAGRANQNRLSCREETSRSSRRPPTQVDTVPHRALHMKLTFPMSWLPLVAVTSKRGSASSPPRMGTRCTRHITCLPPCAGTQFCANEAPGTSPKAG